MPLRNTVVPDVKVNQPVRNKKVALVRHGETDWNKNELIQGQSDIPLNQTGLLQAKRVADWLIKNGTWDYLYASSLSRARMTAVTIGGYLNLNPIICDTLAERKFGALEGLTPVEREQLYPKRLEDESTVPGLELRQDFQERVLKTFEAVMNEAAGPNIIIVSHGGWINQLLYHLSQGAIGSGITVLGNGSISLITSNSHCSNEHYSWDIAMVNLEER